MIAYLTGSHEPNTCTYQGAVYARFYTTVQL